MTFLFRVIAVFLLAGAGYFFWNEQSDWAFAFFAFAVCSWFFGMRFEIKARIEARKAAEDVSEAEPPV